MLQAHKKTMPATHAAPDEDPTDHPLWATQVELERGMMRAGADKVRDAVLTAEKRGQMTRSGVVRGLLADWLPGVADAIKGWVRDYETSKGGPKPVAFPYLKAMDPYVAALAGLKAILDNIAKGGQKLVPLAMAIGGTLEHEQQVHQWEEREPDLFYHYADEMDRNRATGVHRRRVNTIKFNAILRSGDTSLHWTDWTSEVRFRVGIAIIDAIMRKTGWFALEPDPEHVWRKGSKKGPQLVLVPAPALKQWLGKAMDNAELNSPDFKPTVIPPRRWSSTRQGGYWTPYVKPPRLVRFKAHQETQKQYAADEYDALDMPEVYDAIHVLQETAWRVNKRVLDVAVNVWATMGQTSKAKLPIVDDLDLPPRTPRMVAAAEAARLARQEHRVPPQVDDATTAEIIDWKRRASPIHRFNAKRFSRMKATSATILCAQEYAGYDRIYFPHMLDFRGRIYPIPTFLQPQGNDLARGLLTFADGLPLTEENLGAGWLAIHLANCWGNDKVSYEDRIAWVEGREVLWWLIAEDPYENTDWQAADKPFQALAAIFEWVDALNTGDGFVSHLPVMVDGTCNGIQHLSAILRDEVAGAYVNLVPADKPQDIYKFVANELQERIEQVENMDRWHEEGGGSSKDHAAYWLRITNRDFPRSLTKRQVMVLPYGGTKDSFFTYTRAWLDEHDPVPPEGLTEDQRDLRTERISFLAQHLWASVNHAVSSGMKVMEWLQQCAKAVAEANQPIYWRTPSGFIVRHFYGVSRAVVHKLLLDNTRVEVTRHERTAKLSPKEQLQGIAPNFIHSLDAAALVLCLKRCRMAGIEDVSAVHDAYGTHAANMEPLAHFLREAFVEVHERDVLGDFRAACQRILVSYLVAKKGMAPFQAAERADELLPEPMDAGNLVLKDILRSEYFFA